MKRIVLFLLALLLLLSACGRTQSEPPTGTEITMEAPSVPGDGEGGKITWRVLDVNSAEGREVKEWLAEGYRQWEDSWENPQTEFPMGQDKTIYSRDYTITLRDNRTGQETVLMERTYFGEATTPDEASVDEVFWKSPLFVQALDDRYFVYDWGGWEWRGDTGVYDTKNMREIPIDWDKKYNVENDYNWGSRFSFLQICGGDLYLVDAEHGPHCGPIHLMRVDLKTLGALKDGAPLMAADALADIPGVGDVDNMGSRFLTEDGRYYVLADQAGLRVYDLKKKQVALELPASEAGFEESESHWRPDYVLPRGNKAYWTDNMDGTGSFLAEITLP